MYVCTRNITNKSEVNRQLINKEAGTKTSLKVKLQVLQEYSYKYCVCMYSYEYMHKYGNANGRKKNVRREEKN